MEKPANYSVVVFGPRRAGMGRTHGAAVVVLLLFGGVEHVHHGHTQVDTQCVDHEETEAGQQGQAVACRATCWSWRIKKKKKKASGIVKTNVLGR